MSDNTPQTAEWDEAEYERALARLESLADQVISSPFSPAAAASNPSSDHSTANVCSFANNTSDFAHSNKIHSL